MGDVFTIADLSFLVGVWKGRGRAEYPTIETAEYVEELVWRMNGKDPVLHYEQQTWFGTGSRDEGSPVFWESGFLIDKGNGSFELASAQKSGRMEILRGGISRENGGLVLNLESTTIVNDERMVRSSRHIRLQKEELSYELMMTTTSHRSHAIHLRAILKKMPT